MPRTVGRILACCLVMLLSAAAPSLAAVGDPPTPPLPPALAQTIATVQAKPAYDHSLWGLEVRDLHTGELLVAQNTEQLFLPGSIFKVLSTGAALDALGADHRFRTPVHRRGAVRGGTLTGDLVLVGSGDYSFGLREQPDGTLSFNSSPEIDHHYADTGLPGPALVPDGHPLAGVEDLARQVRESGIRRVRGDVVVDDRLFAPYAGWPNGLVTPIWVNENVIDVTSTPTAEGQPARVDWRPKTAAWRVVGSVTTGPAGGDPAVTVERVRPGVLRVSGSVPAGGDPILTIFDVPDPAAFARTAFVQALRRHGVRVDARPTGRNPAGRLPARSAYPAATRVAQRVSPPLSEYAKVILKVSYNTGANLMLCLVAVEAGSRNCEDGVVAELATNARLGAPGPTTIAFDGAGSDDLNRTSPSNMTAYLRAAAGQPWGAALRAGLPLIGVDGTLASVAKDSPARGRIQAKTGNRVGYVTADIGIAGGQTHVGYITAASGRELVFADLIASTPLTHLNQIFEIDDDMGEIEAAIQQAF